MSEQERGVERVAIAKMVTDDLATYFGRQPKRTWSGRELDRMLRQLRAEPTGIAKRLAARESQP